VVVRESALLPGLSRHRSASSAMADGSASALSMSFRSSSAIGTSSSTDRTLRARWTSLGRSRVSRLMVGLVGVVEDATGQR
jgi:hypothetical protein